MTTINAPHITRHRLGFPARTGPILAAATKWLSQHLRTEGYASTPTQRALQSVDHIRSIHS